MIVCSLKTGEVEKLVPFDGTTQDSAELIVYIDLLLITGNREEGISQHMLVVVILKCRAMQ